MPDETRTQPPDAPPAGGGTRTFGAPDGTGTFAPPASADPEPVPFVPGYEVLEPVGRGGMGRVYKARQLATNRVVALKLILAGEFAGASARQRFKAEIEITATLSHPHIVQLYEAGEADGRAFLSCEFVPGGSLASRLDGTPWEAKRAARLLGPLVRAVAHAHRANIIHRDLKPANVLLTANGQAKVADFGIAKRLDADFTNTGAVMGTPSYMPPEQAGSANVVGPAADVYALGAIFYELLTGRAPFKGADFVETIDLVRTQEPVPPSALNPKVPRDAETICLKCLQKAPEKRYATADALADDLERFLENRPIVARPVGSVERAWRWARRNPAVAGLLASLVLVFATGSAVAWYFAAQAEAREREAKNEQASAATARAKLQDEQAKAADERHKAEVARDAAENLLYAGRVYQANIAAGEYRTKRLLQLLDEARPRDDETDRRGWEWHYLKRLTRTWDAEVNLPVPAGATEQVLQYTFSPDGARIAVTAGNGFDSHARPVGVFETATGKLVSDLAGLRRRIEPLNHTGGLSTMTFGPDLAFAAVVDRVEVVGHVPPGFVGPPREKTHSRARLFDIRGAEPGPGETVFAEADVYPNAFVAAGGNRVVISASSGDPDLNPGFKSFVEVWDRGGGTPRRTRFQLGSADAYVVAVSPDGLFAVVSGVDAPEGGKGDAPVRGGDLWSLGDKPARVKRLVSDSAGNMNWFPLAAFSPNGRVLAVPEPGGAVGVFDARTGARLGRWPVPRDVAATFVRDLSVSDDGRRLTCAGKGGTLVAAERVGNLVGFYAPGAPVRPDRDPDGVWRATVFRQPQRGNDLGEPLGTGATLSADGRRLFAPVGPVLRHWDLTRTGFAAAWPEVEHLGGQLALVAPEHRGRALLYSTALGGAVGQQEQKFHFRVLDSRTKTARDFDAVGQSMSAVMSSDGRRVLLAQYGQKPRWSLRAADAPEKEIADGGTLARFSDDGRWLYPDDRYFVINTGASGALRSVWVRRAADGRPACDVPVPPGETLAGAWAIPGGVLLLATRPSIDPKGERKPDPVALTFRFHDIETGALRGTWTSPAVWAWTSGYFGPNSWALPPPRVFHAADGGQVGARHTAPDGAVRVWVLNGGTGAPEGEFSAPAPAKTGAPANPLAWGEGNAGAFEPGGRVSVWSGADVVTWARPGAAPVRLTGHQFVAAVAFTADGRRAFTLDAPFNEAEAVLRAWDPASGRELLTIRFPTREQGLGGPPPATEMWLEGERLHVLTSHGVRVFDGTPLDER